MMGRRRLGLLDDIGDIIDELIGAGDGDGEENADDEVNVDAGDDEVNVNEDEVNADEDEDGGGGLLDDIAGVVDDIFGGSDDPDAEGEEEEEDGGGLGGLIDDVIGGLFDDPDEEKGEEEEEGGGGIGGVIDDVIGGLIPGGSEDSRGGVLGGVVDVIAPVCSRDSRTVILEDYTPIAYEPQDEGVINFFHGIPRVTGVKAYDPDNSKYVAGVAMVSVISFLVIMLAFGGIMQWTGRINSRKAAVADSNAIPPLSAELPAPSSHHVGKFTRVDIAWWCLGGVSIAATCFLLVGMVQLNEKLDETGAAFDVLSEFFDVLGDQLRLVINEVADSLVLATEVTLQGTVGCVPFVGNPLASAAIGAATTAANTQREEWLTGVGLQLDPTGESLAGRSDSIRGTYALRLAVISILGLLLLVSTLSVIGVVSAALVKYRRWKAGEVFADTLAPRSSGARRAQKTVNWLTVISVVTGAIIASMSLGSAVLVSDYCINPDDGAVTLFDGGESAVRYYQTCDPSADLPVLLNQLDCYVEELGDTVVDLSGVAICSGRDEKQELEDKVASAQRSTDALLATTACSNVNPIYAELSYISFCDGTVRGTMWMWIGGILNLCAWAGMIYLYYTQLYKVHEVPGLWLFKKNSTARLVKGDDVKGVEESKEGNGYSDAPEIHVAPPAFVPEERRKAGEYI
ncbi:unnamed protein product [Chrysoparadoxa australica]